MKLELRQNKLGHWMVVCNPGIFQSRVVFDSGETGAQGVRLAEGVKNFLAIRQNRAWDAWKHSDIVFSDFRKTGS